MTRQQYSNEVATVGAAVGANPTNVAFFRFGTAADATGQPTMTVVVRFTFYAQFLNRDVPGQS